MALPVASASRAVLIGVSDYAHLPQLASVRANVLGLASALSEQTLGAFAARNCVEVYEPQDQAALVEPIAKAASEATDTLLVYYAGHGLIESTRGELYLTLVGSRADRNYTAVPYQWIREELLNSRAARRVVLLDCCYSGRALGAMGSSEVADEASSEGTYILAAAAENRRALAPPDERYTAFTGEFLDVVTHGVVGAGELLDLDTIFRKVRQRMTAKARPVPQKRDRNTAGALALFRNKAYEPPTKIPASPLGTRTNFSMRRLPATTPRRGISGPYDIANAPKGVETTSFGSLRIPNIQGIEVHVNADVEGAVQEIVLVDGKNAAQIGIFAADPGHRIWDAVRSEIIAKLIADGTEPEEIDGDYGVETRAYVQTPEGVRGIRFVGIDGPRWFIRVAYQGLCAFDRSQAGVLADAVRGIVIDRGHRDFAERAALPLQLPPELNEQKAKQSSQVEAPAGARPGPAERA